VAVPCTDGLPNRTSGSITTGYAGESVAQIAAGYDMADELVRAAVAYEEQLRSLAA